MSMAAADARELPGAVRFQLVVQRNRLAGYAVATSISLLLKSLGQFPSSYGSILAVGGSALASAGLLTLYVRAAHARGWPAMRNAVWVSLDLLLASWAVFISGGAHSPVYVWYLTICAAAAFVFGRRGILLYVLASVALYLGVLGLLGQAGWFDERFFSAVARMAFLYGGGSLFLWGITDVQAKREEIRRLREADARKLDELTRLARSLDQRGRELEDANLKIVEANRLKSQFLANMSHELRTPLNSIIGFSEILQSRLDGQISDKHRKFLENIHGSGQHLLTIINDILDLSKIEAGTVELLAETFPLRSVVDGVCAVMRGALDRRGSAIRVEIPENLPLLQADPVKVKQIVYNLVSNAVKFSPEGCEVILAARALDAATSPLGSDSIEITVEDRGIGIESADQESIFQEFRQVDNSATRRFEGTGLGLALVRKYCELHGGRVSVRSEPGAGSTFTVLLPRRQGARPAEPPRAPVAPTPGPPLVLVVEDDDPAADALERELSGAGYRTARARHGDAALEMVRRLAPAAITLDLILPGTDGWDVLRRLKADPATAGIPIIIISLLDNQELGLALGAADFLLKPVDRDSLVRRLNRYAPLADSQRSPLLIVDDDPAVHALLAETLEPLGYPLMHAYGGGEGIAAARDHRPALVILDLMMPEINGFEVAAQLRRDPATRDLPVLVLTAKDLTGDDKRLLAGKIAAVVRKGGAHAELLATIRGLLSPSAGATAAPGGAP